MQEHPFVVRLFLMGGGALALLGFILWFVLPVRLSFPPFLLTALLAMAYGLACRKRGSKIKDGKKTKA